MLNFLSRLNPFKALGHFLKEHTLTIIIYSLIGNTALAQLFYNSAGVILPSQDWRTKYLIFSAVLSMIAFSLFELHVVRQLKTLLALAKEIRKAMPWWELPAHMLTLSIISLYNIYSLFLLNAVIWPSLEATVSGKHSPAPTNLPELPGLWKFLTHAVFYSVILFLAAVVVERKKSAAEQAAEEDDMLHKDTINGSNDYYRTLIHKGGRNVAIARGVLSTKDAAKQQAKLLAALEGQLGMEQAVEVAADAPVRVVPAPPMPVVPPVRVTADGGPAAPPDVPPATDNDLPPVMPPYNGQVLMDRLGMS